MAQERRVSLFITAPGYPICGWANGAVGQRKSLVSLHDRIGNEIRGYLLATKPTTVQTFNGPTGSVDIVKLDVDLTLNNAYEAE